MIRTRGQSLLVAAATLWAPLYLAAFVVVVFVILVSGPEPGSSGGPPGWFITLFGVHLFTIVLGFALLAVYLVDVVRNPDLEEKSDMRIMWVLLVVFAGSLAGGSASFTARTAAAS